MNILQEIIAHKFKEVEERKGLYPVRLLEKSIYFETTPVSLSRYLTRPDKSGIIAEIKRKSPSKGVINGNVSVERVSIGYMQAGASALSVLTDRNYFGGSNEDLTTARKFNFCPILRKDFIVDEYQILEAKSIGADAILLIAAALAPERLKTLCDTARALQLEVLMEIHNEKEWRDNENAGAHLVGVNNRNLETFEVSLDVSRKLSASLPKEIVKVTESGIEDPKAILEMKKYGYSGFLIGQTFMQSSRPEKAALEFIRDLRKLEKTSAG